MPVSQTQAFPHSVCLLQYCGVVTIIITALICVCAGCCPCDSKEVRAPSAPCHAAAPSRRPTHPPFVCAGPGPVNLSRVCECGYIRCAFVATSAHELDPLPHPTRALTSACAQVYIAPDGTAYTPQGTVTKYGPCTC